MRVGRNGVLGFIGALAAGLLVLALAAVPAVAQETRPLRGVALVIGNGAYQHLPALANPAADARAMEGLLAGLGFETDLAADRDSRRLRRDVEGFVDDAEGADVAVVYYAGHGIEAGGDNFLVPVDADPSTLERAGEDLVALSRIVARLQLVVPVVVVLLDACRDNPFPPGATLRLVPDGPALAVSASGLGAARGGAALSDTGAVDNLGTVLGFATEPGRAALDGEPGGNSPYAAAMLRHMETMAGEEFGTVMRLVAEEVYLKTGGRQRPWTNESLRRLLHFGAPRPLAAGDAADIMRERRQLLLTISALPEPGRLQVEALARRGEVPLDALFAMLDALGEEAPDDPLDLERLLSAQAERLRGLLADRAVLVSSDQEIVRLASLADEALREGALRSAIRFHERAKQRVGAISGALDDAEAQLRQRRVEFAEVFARSAGAQALAFDHLEAARDWRHAFDQIARWDDGLALRYKLEEAASLTEHGLMQGDAGVLEAALAAGDEALLIAARPAERVVVLDQQANGWKALGEVTGDLAAVERAVALQREALEGIDREAEPVAWAALNHNLGNTLHVLGESAATGAYLEQALAAFSLAASVWTREAHPRDWALLMSNMGTTLWRLAERDGTPESLLRAARAQEAALEVWTRETEPLGWAMAVNSLGNTLYSLVERNYDGRTARHAIDALQAALTEFTRERAPQRWAMVMGNLAKAYRLMGSRDGDAGLLRHSIALFQEMLDEVSSGEGRLQWASAQNGLGNAWSSLYAIEGGEEAFARAVASFENALTVWTAETAPLDRSLALGNLGIAHQTKWIADGDPAARERALAAFEGALAGLTREEAPAGWAHLQSNIGNLHLRAGREAGDRLEIAQAIASYDRALEVLTRRDAPEAWASTLNNLGLARFELARLSSDADLMLEAVESFRASLAVRTAETMPDEWGRGMDSIGLAFYEAASLTGERRHAVAAGEAWLAAGEHFSALGQRQYEAYFAERVALARDLAGRR